MYIYKSKSWKKNCLREIKLQMTRIKWEKTASAVELNKFTFVASKKRRKVFFLKKDAHFCKKKTKTKKTFILNFLKVWKKQNKKQLKWISVILLTYWFTSNFSANLHNLLHLSWQVPPLVFSTTLVFRCMLKLEIF